MSRETNGRRLQRHSLEIEKQKLQAISSKRGEIYPQILELTYRLRNKLREGVQEGAELINKRAVEESTNFYSLPTVIAGLHPELGELTEDLYKFRAYVEPEVFEKLHRFKRLMQEAHTIFDRLSRSDLSRLSDDALFALAFEVGINLNEGLDHSRGLLRYARRQRAEYGIRLRRLSEQQAQLNSLNSEANDLFLDITDGVRRFMESARSIRNDLTYGGLGGE